MTPDERRAREAERREAIIEDATFLLDQGTHPDDVARRLGYKSRDNMLIALHRWGEEELARRMWTARADAWQRAEV